MRRFLLAWLLLLAASYAARWAGGLLDARARAAERADAAVAAGAGALERRGGRMVYTLREGAAGAPVLVFLHGSPGSRHDFDAVIGGLDPTWTVLAPDLPGFGDSGYPVDDYSIRAHAADALALLDARGVEAAHVVGFSMGTGVMLELARLAPERVRSMSFVAGIGVQELELFGNYALNHALHDAQVGALLFATWAVPHFGLLDDTMLDPAYAWNFHDSDQRPLRGVLESATMPALIVHGEHDFLVPPEAAREHHRLLPQSELRMLDASHFLPWAQTDDVGDALQEFVRAVEAGAATTRATADPARVAAAAEPFDPADLPPFAGPALLAAFLLLMLGTLVSEDLTCIATGLLVAQGRIELPVGAAACFLGIFVGDTLLYLAGRWFGVAALHRAPAKWVLKPGAVARARRWFERRGPLAIFLSRFMPGLRLPTYFAAGVVGTGLLRFAFWFALAGLLWTPTLVWLSSLAGRSLEDAVGLFQEWAPLAFVGLLLAVFLLERLVVPLCTWRGRRLLRGRWLRRRRWEYWPRWAMYAPVLPAVLGAALRHRSLRVVTAVNPGIQTGGLVGESKSAILAGFGDAPEIARFRLLRAPGELAPWMAELGLDWPVVLKPDRGERGKDVAVVRSAAEAAAYFEEHGGAAAGRGAAHGHGGAARGHAVLAQEYVPGEEYGVFWIHEPGAPRGRVWSLCRKELPTVVGDGTSDLERLVLAHPRHVAMAPTLLEGLGERAFEVPAAGARVTVGALGTHARGATFHDANHLRTPELEEAVARLAARFPGFRFGRFDLRVADEASLRAGRGLKVLELNGLTSEAAHIYDPAAHFGAAVRTLREQWRIAFRIGAANVAAGARPSSWREVLRALRG